MSNPTQTHVNNMIEHDVRFDGRGPRDYRPITIETNVSASAEGSAKVTIGDTVVIAGVKLSLEKPYPDTQDQGNLMVSAELLPLSSPDFESGPPSIEAIELARVTDRAIRESGIIDVKDLCVVEGEQVWSVIVDICTINHAGNLFDAANLAALAALQAARFPTVTDGVVDYKTSTDKKLPLKGLAIAVTAYKIGNKIAVDPTPAEEKAAVCRLTVGVMDGDILCSMQKGGEGSLSLDEVKEMVSVAMEQAAKNREALSS